jgi:DNA-binding transcriptional LysR family regulator
MIACVAAGTGFAIVPKSVLTTLNAAEKVKQHTLPPHVSKNRTHLVWRGEPSRALKGLITLLQTVKKGNIRARGRQLGARVSC